MSTEETADSSAPQTWVGKLIAGILNIFHKAEPIVDEIVGQADKVVNVIKTLESSQVGQFLIDGVETIIPSSTGLINAFNLWFPKIAGIITTAQVETGKTDAQKVQDLITYLQGLKTNDPVLYAGALNTINTAVQQFLSTNQGVILTIPQSLAIGQVAHDPTLGVAA